MFLATFPTNVPTTPPRFSRFVSWVLCITPLLAAVLGVAVLAAPLTASAAAVTGSGQLVTETRSVAGFQAIELATSMDLAVRQGGTQSVQIQLDDNLLPLLETVVENKSRGATLVVRWKSGQSLYHRSKPKLTVVLPALSALSLTGSGNAVVQSFNTPALQVSVSGVGDVKLPGLITEELAIRISGSGDVTADGKASKLKVTITGSGDVRLKELVSSDATVSIAGSGDAAVNAQKTLDVSIAGSGDVVYGGSPKVTSKVAGSGSVRQW